MALIQRFTGIRGILPLTISAGIAFAIYILTAQKVRRLNIAYYDCTAAVKLFTPTELVNEKHAIKSKSSPLQLSWECTVEGVIYYYPLSTRSRNSFLLCFFFMPWQKRN